MPWQLKLEEAQAWCSRLLTGRLFCPPQRKPWEAYDSDHGFDLIITTGKITFVGEEHIEYNVNTVHGHSGAAVVVQEAGHRYHGKPIAIHVGFEEEFGTNIGFKLQGMSFD
jgi:hypothetical protein